MSDGERYVELAARKVLILEPWRAGQYDPPMQEWLQLPVGDACPTDESHVRWGTMNPIGYFAVRVCRECNTKFRGEVTPHDIQRVVDALCGTPVRLGR